MAHCLLRVLHEGVQSLMLTSSTVSQGVQWDQSSTATVILWCVLLFWAVALSEGAESFLCVFVPPPPHTPVSCWICVHANSQARGYPTECVLWFVFKGCCWVTTLPPCWGELWIAINQWHTVSQLPDWLRCHIYIAKWAYTESAWAKVSLPLLHISVLLSFFSLSKST